MKIHITGNAGSGKTTFARKLGDILEIPVYSLDSIIWKPGWEKTSSNERTNKEKLLANNSAWIIEGVSPIIRKEADLIIFLDYSKFSCITRALKRNIKYLFRSRPELPKNCPELLIIHELFKIIWGFDSVAKPKILSDMNSKKSIRIRNDRESTKFINKVHKNKSILPNHLKLAES